MATITKRELSERIASKTRYTQVAVKQVVQAFLDEIVEELAKGNRLEFRDFGVFEVRIQAPRKARNPRRPEEEVHVPAKTVAHFKPGKLMAQRVKQAMEYIKPAEEPEPELPPQTETPPETPPSV